MVSHESYCLYVANKATRLPLSPYCNPLSAPKDSLGDFHNSTLRLLSSFASRLSQGNITLRLRPEVCVPDTSIPFCSRKAGYSAHSVRHRMHHTAMQVHILLRTEVAYHAGSTLLHNNRSPQKKGRDLHAIEGRPSPAGVKFTPSLSTHPKLGVRSRHHGFHSYAL